MLVKLIRRLISSPARIRTLFEARRSRAHVIVKKLSKAAPRRRRPRDRGTHQRPLGSVKGTAYKSIIQAFTVAGRDFQLHSTKGWRSYRST